MTTATQNEEDLIIIWDETSNDVSMLDFNFTQDTNIQTQQEPVSDFVIDFEDTPKTEVKTDFVLDETPSLETQAVSSEIDLFNISEVSEVTPELNINTEEKKDSLEIDFGFGEVSTQEPSALVEEDNKQEITTDLFETGETLNQEITSDLFGWVSEVETEVTQTLNTSFDRNSILDEAIAKMQSRKTSIAQTKSSKQSKVDDLNEQIKVLKNQVSDLEKEIKDIEKEDSALDLDITSIEKMKESVLEVSTDRPRKHNLSNIKK